MSDGFCGTHLQIMVRTRGLVRALGQVTGRGVGRGDRDDSNDAPQRRRTTASARRQRVVVTADHVDEPVIPAPDVQDDPMEAPATVDDIPADTGTEAAEDENEGFPGGSSDPSVLTLYADHIACSVWRGEERPELKLSSHGRKVHSLDRPVPTIEGLIAGTGLSPLITCSVDTGNRGLLSAFVERWHRETSSFHLLVGELTIMLDDVSSLLHLPVIGDLHAFQCLHVDDAVQMLVDLLMVSTKSARAETTQCRGPYVHLQWVRDIYERRCQTGHWTTAACAYLLHLLGCTLFANKSAINVHVVYLEAPHDLIMTERYAWGVAALVDMYDQLNDASMSHSRQLGGYITLLQCWIYEHFPSVAESTADQDYDEASLRARRWIATKKTVKSIRTSTYRERLDRLWIPNVCWIPYGEHREVRNFHVSFDDTHDKWMHYSDHIAVAVCQRLHGLTLPHFASIHDTGPTIRSSGRWLCYAAQSFPSGSRHRYPFGHGASSTIDISKVQCGRAETCSACYVIVERLESHLNLGVVMPGASTHELIKECLRIARSVTQDQLVYVRSERRQRTDQTRGLGRALGRVIGRALGERIRRRPTASAGRQQGVIPVVEDDPVVAADEPIVAADAGADIHPPSADVGVDVHPPGADTGAEATVDEPEGFPGGPSDPSVFTEYVEHVAANVWTEERWHRETSSFHLPVGEVTITMDDVASLLHLPVVGAFYTFQPLHVDEAVLMLINLLLVSREAARAKTTHCHGPCVRLSWLRDIYQRRCQVEHWTSAAHAYLLHLLGCTLFANKSATHVHVVFLDALCDLSQTGRYAWGAATLVHMYDHLNDVCISTSRQLVGYITLLQLITTMFQIGVEYEHFPSVAQCIADLDYDEVSPCVCQWIATKKTLRWGPIAVRHRPERFVRQFGYVQSIPPQPIDSWESFDEIDDRWMHYSDHFASAGEMCVVPGQCAADYMNWFFVISHPFKTTAQPSDPPRDPPAMHDASFVEPHIPQVLEPVATSTHARSEVDEPIHAVEAYHVIAERLERHLNLRIAHRHMRSWNNASGLSGVSQKTIFVNV
ncbi:Protein MAIN-LIKE 1 [Glycine soja]